MFKQAEGHLQHARNPAGDPQAAPVPLARAGLRQRKRVHQLPAQSRSVPGCHQIVTPTHTTSYSCNQIVTTAPEKSMKITLTVI